MVLPFDLAVFSDDGRPGSHDQIGMPDVIGIAVGIRMVTASAMMDARTCFMGRAYEKWCADWMWDWKKFLR